MAANDVLARMVADICKQMGWHVPNDVAVIGVGDNSLLCSASKPTLSSVARNGREIGYQAAQLLDRLMSGRKPRKTPITVLPAGVVVRQSTDVVAIDDADLAPAVRYIYNHLDSPFTIHDLVRELMVSRRWLEYRFQERLGQSPHDYICTARVQRAKQLLAGPVILSPDDLSRACGFRRARTLQRTFQRLTGMTPAQYRQRKSRRQ
jgi:LacI family transcriptional regulator